ncbi:MAG: hypothetical protein JXR05_07505 [Flavobacteriaceae bacterium]
MKQKHKEIIRIGMPWAIGMFILMTFVFPWFNKEPITLSKVLIALPLWTLGGLLFGYSMNRWLPKEK